MTYRKPETNVHPLLWAAIAALGAILAVIAYLIWSIWPG